MSQNQPAMNGHIETYLDYYCDLPHAPEFAVLLKGQWGSGKTWFINEYRKKLEEKKKYKCLYVSLYGMTSFSEIENSFFQQLHPILSSKGMAITSKIFKGMLKLSLNIDLNNDGNRDGAVNLQIPEIEIPEYFKNVDKSILIFDDLERCKIDLSNILGYINYFVEHQGIKVILVANEDELLKDSSYQVIKEKLIGKTFGISLDFNGALENFISMTEENLSVRTFLCKNTNLIRDLYAKAGYENLRNLKQVILDFERIFSILPDKAKNKPEILQDILSILMIFSIEIKRGVMLPKNICSLQDKYMIEIANMRTSAPESKNDNEEQNSVQKIIDRYGFTLCDPFPSGRWWEIFFDKGIIDEKELEQSMPNSKYFQNENTPNWVKLWHFSDLSDDDFNEIINAVESECRERIYSEVGVIKHIFGLFLMFSSIGLYPKSKAEILEKAKRYIDYLGTHHQHSLVSSVIAEDVFGGYDHLGFQGKDFEEFKELSSHIKKAKESAIQKSMPAAAQDLLAVMKSDIFKFYKMISLGNSHDKNLPARRYYETPILQHIDPNEFIKTLLSMNFQDQRSVIVALKERYNFDGINESLIKELEWLESIKDLLDQEIIKREGKPSGFFLKLFTKDCLDEVIEKLKKKKAE